MTVVFDFVRNRPVLGLDSPLISVLPNNSFLVEGKVLSRDELQQWIVKNDVVGTARTIQLYFQDETLVERVITFLQTLGVLSVCLHYR